MEPERLLCFSASARTRLGAVKPEPAGSELLLSGSNCPKSLSITESSCQTNARRLGLLHSTSQVESCKQQQPGYRLCYTEFLLPLNCSVMWSFLCHHLHHGLHPMSQDKASVNNQSVSYLHCPLNSHCFSLNRCSHWLNSRCPFPPPTEYRFS